MILTWYGHAAFCVEGSRGDGSTIRIILDPYNYPACGGYLPIDEPADLVIVSHENRRYHSDTSAIQSDFELVEALDLCGGRKTIQGLEIAAWEVYEDDAQAGPNAMYKFVVDDVTIAHQGDLGHALHGDALEFLRQTDVLLALAGGPPTIRREDLRAMIDAVRPRFIVPMHYKTPKVNLSIEPLDYFLTCVADLPHRQVGGVTVEIHAAELPETPTVLLMDHAR